MDTDIVVIGGGVAGLTTAFALAEMRFDVVLLERESELGGHAAQWACMATDTCGKCFACTIAKDISNVLNHPHIKVLTQVEVEEFNGEIGQFTLSISPALNKQQPLHHSIGPTLKPGEHISVNCASIMLATGFREFNAAQKVMLSYGRIPEVLTIKDVDLALKQDDISSIFPEKPITSKIGFIMCVGSRDRKNGSDYCSQFCGKTSVRLINRLKYLRPEYEFDMYYIDLQIMCKEFCTFYNKMQDAITFYQGIPAEVLNGAEKGTAKLYAHNPETGNFEERAYDRIVLAIGIAPEQANDKLANLMGISLNQFGFFEHSHYGGSFVTPIPGIYLAGASAGPVDINSSRLQALAAAQTIAVFINTAKSKVA